MGTREVPVTEVQRELRRRWRYRLPFVALGGLIFVVGLLAMLVGAAALARFTGEGTAYYGDIREHFKYGSIGAEPESGLPYWVWRALPGLFPEKFDGREYEAFGFLYETDADGNRRDLPIGISRREVRGTEVAWFNCAVCHVGTVQAAADAPRRTVLGMPSNNLNLYGFISVLFEIADDERLSADSLIAEMERQGADFDWLDKLAWRFYVIPRVREGLLQRRARLGELVAGQPAWGPGRVDTFNPYKAIQFGIAFHDITPAERIGTADFPSIFLQGPRNGMQLHWDGNNTSLQERNLSAAIGAGVTEETVDHAAIERVAAWLQDLEPPPSPYRPDPALAARGRDIYMSACADCHGYKDGGQLPVQGRVSRRGGPDRADRDRSARGSNSYTSELAEHQKTLFENDPEHHFRHFRKTDDYANSPLDGLWLRAPYLHNGAVPTLRDLLAPAAARPVAFVRGLDRLDPANGGFVAPPCTPGAQTDGGFCFDTKRPGNGNGGHLYGTELPNDEKEALLAYLLTF